MLKMVVLSFPVLYLKWSFISGLCFLCLVLLIWIDNMGDPVFFVF